MSDIRPSIIKAWVVIGTIACFVGCVRTPYLPKLEPSSQTNFILNEEMEVRVGEAMVQSTTTTYIQREEWMGILLTPGGWRRWNEVDKTFRRELVYSGKSGSTLRVTYREYVNDLARPAFYQELSYDLNESSEIVFKLRADSASLMFDRQRIA
jgi:hypothetical protein